jgi:hypothetical protein
MAAGSYLLLLKLQLIQRWKYANPIEQSSLENKGAKSKTQKRTNSKK